MHASAPLSPDLSMGEILESFPSARRALFARYHIGGCQSCSYRPEETLAQVCARNENVPVEEAINHILDSQRQDDLRQLDPAALAAQLDSPSPPALIDLRTREEFDAVKLPGALLLTQELSQEIVSSWPRDRHLVLYDHTGDRALDAAAYLVGHGLPHTLVLKGGIDAYAREVDPSLPRYRIELDD
jgi:rhodanese-related sulfurtransferase